MGDSTESDWEIPSHAEGLSDVDGTGLGRPEGPNVGKAEGLSDWVGPTEGTADDMAAEKRGSLLQSYFVSE